MKTRPLESQFASIETSTSPVRSATGEVVGFALADLRFLEPEERIAVGVERMRIGRLLPGEDAARVAHHEADSADVHASSFSDGPDGVSMSSVSRSASTAGRPG
jgi:hypothetical protein